MDKVATVLKLRKIFNMGYIPSRGNQSYSFVCKNDQATFAQHVNCLAHALFNLTNQQIEDEHFNYNDRLSFSCCFYTPRENYVKQAEQNIITFVETSGLKMRPLNTYELLSEHPELLQENQWIVAMYYIAKQNKQDIHFFLREKDGRWSGKLGFRDEITYFDELPAPYYSTNKDRDVYFFYNTYLITNPNKIKEMGDEKEI